MAQYVNIDYEKNYQKKTKHLVMYTEMVSLLQNLI